MCIAKRYKAEIFNYKEGKYIFLQRKYLDKIQYWR